MKFLLPSLLVCLLLSCSQNKNKKLSLIDYVPQNSEVILKSSNLENLKTQLKTNAFLNKYVLNKNLGVPALNYIIPDTEVLICSSKQENDSIHHTLITKYSESIFKTDSLKNYSEELLKYKFGTIKKSALEDNTFYHTIIDSTFVLSTSEEIIRNTFNLESRTNALEKLYDVADESEELSILIKTRHHNLLPLFVEDSLTAATLTDTLILDIEIEQDNIFLNGVAKSKDSSKKLIDIFKNTIPQENQTQHIAPGNSDGFMSITFDDFQVFQSNLEYYSENDSITSFNDLFLNINEIGVIYQGESRAIALYSMDVIATMDALLGENQNNENYRNIEIFDFSKHNFFINTLSPSLTNIRPTKYCVIDNFFVFSDSIDLLENIIANYQNKTSLGSRSYFKDISNKLSSESSLLLIYRPELLQKIIRKDINAFEIGDYSLAALQFVYDTNFAHAHGGLIKTEIQASQNSITETFSIDLDNDLISSPQFVKNHITKDKEIIVQDVKNTVYLISNKGKVLWKKKLNGPILGEIEQIDIYKNGRLQLVFATPNRVYVLDRKGRDVGPFPLKFNDRITQPLAVFDYDKNKNYRLLVTQGKNILMYNSRGKIVRGFNFKSAQHNVTSTPKHFRFGSKDYLVIKTKSKLYILDRRGKPRVNAKNNYIFSSEPVFMYQNKFTTTTEDGKLVSIDTRGNTSTIDLKLTSNHCLETTSKTRVTLNENKLGIKSKILDLDYGNYTRPSIFYIKDKIYVALTDLQSKKVHLYDSQGGMQPNFPVYGNSKIELDNIDKDRRLEFVVKGDSKSIILYEIN